MDADGKDLEGREELRMGRTAGVRSLSRREGMGSSAQVEEAGTGSEHRQFTLGNRMKVACVTTGASEQEDVEMGSFL